MPGERSYRISDGGAPERRDCRSPIEQEQRGKASDAQPCSAGQPSPFTITKESANHPVECSIYIRRNPPTELNEERDRGGSAKNRQERAATDGMSVEHGNS